MNNDFNNNMSENNEPKTPESGATPTPPPVADKYHFDQQPSGNGYTPPESSKYSFDPNAPYSGQQPQSPYTPYTMPKNDNSGSSSQIMGILSIVLTIVCCPIIGIVLGALAMKRAKNSFATMGYETSEAKTGRICGIIGLVLGIIGTVGYLIVIVFYVVAIVLAMSAEGVLSIAWPLLSLL